MFVRSKGLQIGNRILANMSRANLKKLCISNTMKPSLLAF